MSSSLQTSFYRTFYFLLINFVVSLVLLFLYPKWKKLFTLEVIISAIAASIYHVMIQQSQKASNDSSFLRNLYKLRYLDWAFTTPLMLISLSFILSKGNKIPNYHNYVSQLVSLDLIMILSGYLGENNWLSRPVALGIGFVALFAIFLKIYMTFFSKGLFKDGFFGLFVYVAYLLIWIMYGLIYNITNPVLKNLITNHLDCFAKAILGLLFAGSVLFSSA